MKTITGSKFEAVDITKIGARIKKDLSARFPGVTFSVKTSRGPRSVDVRCIPKTSGIDFDEVEALIAEYNRRSFSEESDYDSLYFYTSVTA